MIKRLLFRLAKGKSMGQAVGFAFHYLSWAIPVKKIYNSGEIIAFYHPKPSYQNHVIISPKKAIGNLQQMSQDSLSGYFVKIWEAANEICAAHPEYDGGFVLIANGGKRQEVQQVHFHLFTDRKIVNEYPAGEQAGDAFYTDGEVSVLKHPEPNWELHFVAEPVKPDNEGYLKGILKCIDMLNAEFGIVQRGYALVYQCSGGEICANNPVFHIVSGKRVG